MWKDLRQTLATELTLESQVEFGHVKYRGRHSNRGSDVDKAKREIWKVRGFLRMCIYSWCQYSVLTSWSWDSEMGTGRNKRSFCLFISKGGFACALFSSALMGSLSMGTIYMMTAVEKVSRGGEMVPNTESVQSLLGDHPSC